MKGVKCADGDNLQRENVADLCDLVPFNNKAIHSALHMT